MRVSTSSNPLATDTMTPLKPARLVDLAAKQADRDERIHNIADPMAVGRPRFWFTLLIGVDGILGEAVESAAHLAVLELAPMSAVPLPPAAAPVV